MFEHNELLEHKLNRDKKNAQLSGNVNESCFNFIL